MGLPCWPAGAKDLWAICPQIGRFRAGPRISDSPRETPRPPEVCTSRHCFRSLAPRGRLSARGAGAYCGSISGFRQQAEWGAYDLPVPFSPALRASYNLRCGCATFRCRIFGAAIAPFKGGSGPQPGPKCWAPCRPAGAEGRGGLRGYTGAEIGCIAVFLHAKSFRASLRSSFRFCFALLVSFLVGVAPSRCETEQIGGIKNGRKASKNHTEYALSLRQEKADKSPPGNAYLRPRSVCPRPYVSYRIYA